jgi:hypothetical protein
LQRCGGLCVSVRAWTLRRPEAKAHGVPPSKPQQWVELAAYAREQGIPANTLLRRLKALHERQGNVLRAYNRPGAAVRKWWFNPVALKAGLERDPEETEAVLAEQLARIEALEAKVDALRRAYQSLKRRVGPPPRA